MDNTNSCLIKKKKKNNNNNSLKLVAVAALLIITPLVSMPLRITYLYFIVNILIIAVGADAGLLSFLLQPKKPHPALLEENGNAVIAISNQQPTNSNSPSNEPVKVDLDDKNRNRSSSEKDFDAVQVVEDDHGIKTAPSSSRPSIFFIGSNEEAGTQDHELLKETNKEDELLEGEDDSELFEKAEMFIGNFYKQLKMQIREDQSSSWSKSNSMRGR